MLVNRGHHFPSSQHCSPCLAAGIAAIGYITLPAFATQRTVRPQAAAGRSFASVPEVLPCRRSVERGGGGARSSASVSYWHVPVVARGPSWLARLRLSFASLDLRDTR
jgi:hypothetical protein